MNPVLPILIIGAAILAGKSLKEQVERISITNFKISAGSIKINEVLLKVTLDVYNPNSMALPFGYFAGYIYRNGIRLGRFEFKDTAVKIPGRSTTPITFNVKITTAGVVMNLFDILKNITKQKPVDLTFSVDGILNIGGYDAPVKYSYNLKNAVGGIGEVNESVIWYNRVYGKGRNNATLDGKKISLKAATDFIKNKGYKFRAQYNDANGLHVMYVKEGIGKPYAKFEFNSNDDMATYLRKPCSDTKFSLNGF